jgi:Na+/melibiose symporter-like transporter
MKESIFSDPAVRKAYVWSKIGVFLVAALLTWPLSRFFGVKAWIGLGAFGVVLGVMTTLVLVAAARTREVDVEESSTAPDSGEDRPDPEGDPIVVPI